MKTDILEEVTELTPVEKRKLERTLRRRIEAYTTARPEVEAMEEVFKKSKADLVTLAYDIHHLMLTLRVKSVNYDDLGRITRSQKGPYCSLKKNDAEMPEGEGDGETEWSESGREEFIRWTEENGLRDVLVKEMPILMRVNSVYRTRLEARESLPPVEARYVDTVAWSKPEKKGTKKK